MYKQFVKLTLSAAPSTRSRGYRHSNWNNVCLHLASDECECWMTQCQWLRLLRLTPGFVRSAIREIYQTRSPQYVSSLLRSTENYINLTTRGLDAADCAALRFILQHGQGVRLNLMWTSIPEGELESLLQLLSNVSQLRSQDLSDCAYNYGWYILI